MEPFPGIEPRAGSEIFPVSEFGHSRLYATRLVASNIVQDHDRLLYERAARFLRS